MIKAEMKRLVKSRQFRIVFLISVVISMLLAYLVISFSVYPNFSDASSKRKDYRGISAVQFIKKNAESVEGEINSEFLANSFSQYREEYAKYDLEFPMEIYYRIIKPINPFLDMVWMSIYNPQKTIESIKPNEASNYYIFRKQSQKRIAEDNFINNNNAYSVISKIDEKINEPYIYQYGIGDTNATEYLSFCVFILAILCTFVSAPAFSMSYFTGEDEIVRCTKYGKKQLPTSRIVAIYLLITILYFLTTGIFLMATIFVYGMDCSPIQICKGALLVAPITENQFLMLVELSGYLSVLAMCSFALFISSRKKNPVVSLAVSMCALLIPTIMAFVGKGGNIETIIRILLPSGGIGFGVGMFYDVTTAWVGKFVTLFRKVLYVPNLRIIVDLCWIILFSGLTTMSYRKNVK